MNAARLEQRFGPADLSFVGFRLWVHWLERDEDQVDGDWLVVSMCCEAEGAEVWVEEMPVLQLPELRAWLTACESLYLRQSEEAVLECLEPHLHITATIIRGALNLRVGITPNPRTQTHEFEFTADQDAFLQLLGDGKKLLDFFTTGEVKPA